MFSEKSKKMCFALKSIQSVFHIFIATLPMNRSCVFKCSFHLIFCNCAQSVSVRLGFTFFEIISPKKKCSHYNCRTSAACNLKWCLVYALKGSYSLKVECCWFFGFLLLPLFCCFSFILWCWTEELQCLAFLHDVLQGQKQCEGHWRNKQIQNTVDVIIFYFFLSVLMF